MNEINNFDGEFSWLSNFADCAVVFEGIAFKSTEHAYQAAKTLDIPQRVAISNAETAGKAKRMGKKITLREDWNDVRLDVMEDLIRQKMQHPRFNKFLMATGDAKIVEGNHWHDTFWGVCNGVGQNNLGKIIMKVRDEYVHRRM